MKRTLVSTAILLASLVAAAGCGGGGGGSSSGPGAWGAGFGLTQRDVLGTLAFPANGPGGTTLGALAITRAFPALTFQSPTYIAAPSDGSNRLFVLQQGGQIYVFPNTDAATQATLFLDISSRLSSGAGEEGLLGLAFDPSYATNGRFYVNYTAPSPNLHTVIASYRVTANPSVADPSSETILLTVDQPFSNHNGGMIGFGPDRMLYIGFGDGGDAGDPNNNAQNRGVLLGKILRIDPNGGSPYAVPSDNPFVGQPGMLGEIWTYGMRNPWRFSWDRQTGTLWCADVGQDLYEEIDLIVRGGNYGWRLFEGYAEFNNPGHVTPSDYVPPIHVYDHNIPPGGGCIIGGYVYRGALLTQLQGAYVFGDFVNNHVFRLDRAGASYARTDIGSINAVTSFGEDRDGEVYATAYSGEVYRFTATTTTAVAFPQHLSDTGLFSDTANLVPAQGLVPYGVTSPLWSDGALKRRWIALPNGTSVGFDPTRAWTFPQGTVLVKHFELPLDLSNPASTRRLETRVLVNQANGWAGYTYRWNAQATDADLLDASATDTFTIHDPAAPGGTRSQTWTYPSRSDCLSCHTQAAGRVLGVRTAQLNSSFDYGGQRDNQLRAWNHIGLFTSDIGSPGQYEAYADPADPSAALSARARSYLAANCAQCHTPGGTSGVTIDFRFDTALAAMQVVDVAPTDGALGLQNPARVRSRTHASSVAWERMRRTDTTRMPPLATRVVDQAGVDLIGAWIDAGPQ